MMGCDIDRAAERLILSGHALADVPAWRLLRLMSLDISSKERGAIQIELDRRRNHGTNEEDLQDPAFRAFLRGEDPNVRGEGTGR